MAILASLLGCIHLVYSIWLAFLEVWTHLHQQTPRPLRAKRSRTPAHLAIALVGDSKLPRKLVEQVFLESVERVVPCCRILDIPQLTIYDREGVLLKNSQDIQERLAPHLSVYNGSVEPEIDYPITPPLSDYSESRARSPVDGMPCADLSVETILLTSSKRMLEHTRRHHHVNHEIPFTLNFVSSESATRAITSTANALVSMEKVTDSSHFGVSVDELNSILEGSHGLGSPDFLIIHSITSPRLHTKPPELHGFPPWQLRLTEIFHTRRVESAFMSEPVAIDEVMFRQGLDEFSRAEMRLGR